MIEEAGASAQTVFLPQPRGVYAITPVVDGQWTVDALLECVEACMAGGVQWVQYRQKGKAFDDWLELAKDVGTLAAKFDVNLILNDAPPTVSLEAVPNCVGVHLGKDDLPIAQARARWGRDIVIGASCYNQLELAKMAARDGATYVAFGAMYSSKTKPLAVRASPSLLAEAKSQTNLPCVAIGGITLEHVTALKRAGADAVALVGALFGAKPDPEYTFAQAAAWVAAMEDNGEANESE